MDEHVLRERADAVCAALRAGDIEALTEDLSQELRQNMGTVVAQLPLPVTEATVERLDTGGFGNVAVLLLLGDAGEVRLTTRWKERDGRPTIVEVSRVTEPEPQVTPEADTEANEPAAG